MCTNTTKHNSGGERHFYILMPQEVYKIKNTYIDAISALIDQTANPKSNLFYFLNIFLIVLILKTFLSAEGVLTGIVNNFF